MTRIQPRPGFRPQLSERLPYHDAECKDCEGGLVRRPGLARICDCAEAGFLVANQERLDFTSGALVWAEGSDILH